MTGLGAALSGLSANDVVYGSLAAAVLFVLARWAKTGVGPGAAITGAAQFDVKNSWVSNSALFGAILVGALKDNFLGALGPTWISTVHLLFALLALVAPIVFSMSVRPNQNQEPQIFVWVYLISAALALWAAFGQLLTLACAIMMATKLKEPILTGDVTRVFLATVLGTALVIAVFAWRAMHAHMHTPPGAQQAPGLLPQAPAPRVALL